MAILNIPEIGMLVDVLDPVNNIWLPGSVAKIERSSSKNVKLEVKLEGYTDEFNINV